MKKLLNLIFKQHNIGIWWGGFINTVSSASMLITIYNMAMITPVAYVTVFQPWLNDAGVDLPFGMFCLFIGIVGLVTLLIQYKFLTPSTFSFWSDQFWEHDNPIKAKLEEQDKRLAILEEQNAEILRLLRRND